MMQNLQKTSSSTESLGNFNYKLLENTVFILTKTLLFGKMTLNLNENLKIVSARIDFILSTKRVF